VVYVKEKQETKEKHPYEVGKNYFIRTVTMNYTGKLVRVTDGELVLQDACWIADTGTRLHKFLQGEYGSSTEIEPFSNLVIVPRTSIIDATIWGVALPKEAR
jgi:hypothetical protein